VITTIDPLTSGQVARICRVSTNTVNAWCDKDLLKHWLMPRGKQGKNKQRRIERPHLVRFMREYGFPEEWIAEIKEVAR
jgi:hypothetical protein